jgi:hypothetical protein
LLRVASERILSAGPLSVLLRLSSVLPRLSSKILRLLPGMLLRVLVSILLLLLVTILRLLGVTILCRLMSRELVCYRLVVIGSLRTISSRLLYLGQHLKLLNGTQLPFSSP